jgi:lipopolysaccharide transport system ATP-binding protein
MKPILEIQNISKRYRIQHLMGGYLSFREKISNALKFDGNKKEDFWALSDVSFQVQPGESIGIIGRNGAGKSTLLKILSKITKPTTGKVIMRGRMASLLEVGTGFHPELTGRENIFFNGSLLGMKRKEIANKFDEIIDFAGTEKFLDTQLKHYSSGMQLRLAFAVAAYLDPEILIIDEVLAVGDAEFQKKCLGKMEDISRSGRTILFVSHNMTALASLCKNSVLLQQGKVVAMGKSAEIVSIYLNDSSTLSNNVGGTIKTTSRSGNGQLLFVSAHCEGDEQNEGRIIPNSRVTFHLQIENKGINNGTPIYLAISIFDEQRVKLLTLDNLYTEQKINSQTGIFSVVCEVPTLSLMPGNYFVDLWCANHFDTYDNIESAFSFSVDEHDIYGTGRVHNKSMHGYFLSSNFWMNKHE